LIKKIFQFKKILILISTIFFVFGGMTWSATVSARQRRRRKEDGWRGMGR